MQAEGYSVIDMVGLPAIGLLLLALALTGLAWVVGLLLLLKARRRTALLFPVIASAVVVGCAAGASMLARSNLDWVIAEMQTEGRRIDPAMLEMTDRLPFNIGLIGIGAASSLLALTLLTALVKRDRERAE
ncbi:MAG: hypothetical protein ACYTGX_03950 [Planctomycetota bacterium]|jgi:hypothetical protein